MIAICGERTLLLRIFARRVSPCDDGITVASASELPATEVAALFSESSKRGDLPHTIVVGIPNLREFFAWVSTYMGHWSPLTSRVRVVRRSEANDILSPGALRGRMPLEVVRALSSLVVGELLCEWTLAGEKSLPTVLSLRSTFGYAAVAALLYRRSNVPSLLDLWERAQRILNLQRRRIERPVFANVWQAIVACLNGTPESNVDSDVLRILTDIVTTRRLPSPTANEPGRLFGRFEPAVSHRRREDAVVELERWLTNKEFTQSSDRLLTACLAAGLSQGALTHFDVLARMTKADPETLLWYSFVSGLMASEPSSQLIERLMFRLSGDFEGGDLERCGDVLIDELEVLAQSDGSVSSSVGLGVGFITVELTAGVCVSFRTRERPNAASHGGLQSGKNDEQNFEDLLQQLRTLFQKRTDPPQKKRRRK